MSQLHPNTLIAGTLTFLVSLLGFWLGVPWAALGGLVALLVVVVLD